MKSYDNLHRWGCQRKTRLNIASPYAAASISAFAACRAARPGCTALYFYAEQVRGFLIFFRDVEIISTDAQKQ